MDIHQARQLAQDESTAPEKLRELANSTDLIVRKNIVINPNIPPDVLIKLAAEFPKQVFDNPAIDLLLLETPDLFSGTLANALCSLLKRVVSTRMIEYAANSSDKRLKLAILMNPQTPQETLKELAKNRNYQVQEATELHINSTNQNTADSYKDFVKAKIQQQLVETDQSYQKIIGDVGEIIKLYEYLPAISYYQKSRTNQKKSYPQVTLKEVEELMREKRSVLDIASNPHISIDIINKLLEHHDTYQIGRRLALNPSTPNEVLEELARSNYHYGVHEAIVLNKDTPVYILEIILNHSNGMCDYVHKALGRNNKLSACHLLQLVNKSWHARVPVFNNPNTSEYLREKLIETFKKGWYSHQYKQFINATFIIPISKDYPQEFINNLYVPGEFIELCVDEAVFDYKYKRSDHKKKQSLSLQILAFHPNITTDSLKKLLAHENELVRKSASLNCKTPQYITEVWGMPFLKTLNQNELKSLASNFYATEELLKELVNHQDITVSRTAASNPCASDEILEEWETSPFYKEGVLEQIMAEEQRLLDRWESSISASNRLTVLLNFETPVSVLAKISRSSSWLERYAIAQNPNTPYPIIQRLAEDGNRIVRAAAKAKL